MKKKVMSRMDKLSLFYSNKAQKMISNDIEIRVEWENLIRNLYAKACCMQSDDYNVDLSPKDVRDPHSVKGKWADTVAFNGFTDYRNEKNSQHPNGVVKLGHNIKVEALSKYVFKIHLWQHKDTMQRFPIDYFLELLRIQYKRMPSLMAGVLHLMPANWSKKKNAK